MKTNFIIIVLSFMVSSVYAQPRFCPEAGFSDEQKAQAKMLRHDFRASVESLSKEERQAKRAELEQTILDTIAETDEQRTALAECFERRSGKRSCPEAGLSDEQKVQWKALRHDFRASVEGLSKEEKQAKRAELEQQVLETIPETDEQKVALVQCFKDWKQEKKARKK